MNEKYQSKVVTLTSVFITALELFSLTVVCVDPPSNPFNLKMATFYVIQIS